MELATLRRLHSAIGLFPLGAYLLFHAWEHWPVRAGREALFARLAHGKSAWFEGALVLVFLLLHGALGCWLWRRERAAGRPALAYVSPAFHRLQLATGLVAAGFVLFHLAGPWWAGLRDQPALGASFGALRDQAGTLPGLIAYVLGVSAVCVHFGQGLGAALTGLSEGRVPPRLSRALGVLLGAALWLVFLDELAVYATGARFM